MATKGATRKGVSKGTKKSKAHPRTKDPVAPFDPAKPLENRQHERFVCEYIKDFNGSQAYCRANPDVEPNSAKVTASRLLTDANVRARVEHLAREALSGERMNAMQVLAGMARIASLDPRKAFDTKGNMLDIPNLPDEVALAIQGIEVTEEFQGRGQDRESVGFTKKLKFNDRLAALRDLGKYFKLFMEKDEKPPETEDDRRAISEERAREARTRLARLGAPVTLEAGAD